MTPEDFNTKYQKYLEKGHYGMSIEDEKVIQFLDTKFSEFIALGYNFTFSQIKTKFGEARVYIEGDERIDTFTLENNINQILKKK